MTAPDYDAVIVGASAAGCTAARLLGERGARVALVEKRPDLDAYKTVCTHFIQPSAVATLQRLGLAEIIEQRGGLPNPVELWSPYSGWLRWRDGTLPGYNITRRTLDPIMRRQAAETPGVDLLLGDTVVGLTGDGRPRGVEVQDRAGQRRRITGRLVVGADGRESHVARLAGVRGRVRPHNRFFYWAYWRGVTSPGGRSRMWVIDPDFAYTFPNEDDLTIVLVAPHRDRRPEFKADLEGAYRRMIDSLPDPPDLSGATRESKMLGKLEVPNVSRPAARPGLALIGDAALASDPLWGVGCGWAFQSAEWLADETADALVGGGDLDTALERYRKLHRRRLGPHHFVIADIASGRKANAFERAMYRAAATDDVVWRAFSKVGGRERSPATLLNPRVLAHIARPRGASAVAA